MYSQDIIGYTGEQQATRLHGYALTSKSFDYIYSIIIELVLVYFVDRFAAPINIACLGPERKLISIYTR
jgi:hypothetical protein